MDSEKSPPPLPFSLFRLNETSDALTSKNFIMPFPRLTNDPWIDETVKSRQLQAARSHDWRAAQIEEWKTKEKKY